MKSIPNFDIEDSTNGIVAGCDEAGRGPLCGPVVAAAVVFLTRDLSDMPLITDSKKMTAAQRKVAFDWIHKMKDAGKIDFGIAECSPSEIDKMNILQASLTAMRRATEKLAVRPALCLIDGNKVISGLNCQAVVKGDSKSMSIAAASVLAKVSRDEIMKKLDMQFPMYCWAKNAGYPTPAHLAAISEFGINEHYRKSYAPVKKLLD